MSWQAPGKSGHKDHRMSLSAELSRLVSHVDFRQADSGFSGGHPEREPSPAVLERGSVYNNNAIVRQARGPVTLTVTGAQLPVVWLAPRWCRPREEFGSTVEGGY